MEKYGPWRHQFSLCWGRSGTVRKIICRSSNSLDVFAELDWRHTTSPNDYICVIFLNRYNRLIFDWMHYRLSYMLFTYDLCTLSSIVFYCIRRRSGFAFKFANAISIKLGFNVTLTYYFFETKMLIFTVISLIIVH